MITVLQSRLYVGRSRDAWDLIDFHRRELATSLFRRVQHTRVEIANWRARAALALALEGGNAHGLQAIALEQARRIGREQMPWSNPFATLIRATVAYQQGDRRAAIDGLTAAAEGFTSADMHMHAAACRRRLGILIRGSDGAALRADADRFFAQQDVRNPTALLRVIAPGFPD